MFEKKRSSKIPILIIAFIMLVGGFYIGKFLENRENEDKQVIKPIVADTDSKENEVILKKDSKLKFTIKYTKCEHVNVKEEKVPDAVVGFNEKKLKEYIKFNYPDWRLISFSEKGVELVKEIDSYCDKHYEMIEENGYIIIYKYDENGNKNLVEKTEFTVTSLPSIDQEQIKAGLVLDSLEEVNQRLEDFGS
ncbi:hypothetical protein [Tepidibacter formicigenes]|jgi:hypothetical protein|uniref:BofC C-terminal domain-containing protein n=1 Tax=Tepidibacter formicigenes DSM 15518 TaxID=1123349 RepID=A0A1M6MX04_9FIRM|nr:hypothetical protein [Tepidibacter formicigenes]SHJ87920.1 hypothetical protein SAMN02744037_01085 [Tepidibacter formicigenes DSM 15518]